MSQIPDKPGNPDESAHIAANPDPPKSESMSRFKPIRQWVVGALALTASVIALIAGVLAVGRYAEKVTLLENEWQLLRSNMNNLRMELSGEEKKDTQGLRVDLQSLKTQLDNDEKGATAYDTKLDHLENESKSTKETLTKSFQHIADDCFTARFAAVPADQKTALRALTSMRAASVAMTRFVEVRISEMINSMFLTSPTEIELARIEGFERVTDGFAQLWDVEPGQRPKIYDVVTSFRDSIDPKKRNTDDGRRARYKLETILQADSTEAYSIAQLLLAAQWLSAHPGGGSEDDCRHAIVHAENAKKATPCAAAAWTLWLQSETSLAYLEWQLSDGKRTFAEQFGELWPQWHRVEQYDETQVGHFKYLNNSVYTLALAFLVLSDERPTHRVPIADFEKAMKRPLEEIVRIGSTMAEQLMQGAIEEEDAQITAAQFYTGLAMLLRSVNLDRSRSDHLKGVCPTLARKKTEEIFEPAWLQLQRVIDTYPVNWNAERIEDRLRNDELFSKWPSNLKDRTRRKK
jgi:hypothetical protein